MPLDQDTCFSRAKKFASFVQGNNLGPESGSVIIDLDRGTSTTVNPDPAGMCWAYCCMWVRMIKVDRGYMVGNLSTLEATLLQADYASRHPVSDTSNALILALGGTQMDYHIVHALLNGSSSVKACLDRCAGHGNNFLMLTLFGANWAHEVALKLDRSTTGGWLNWSYPCAMFDPNVGQGMYNNHQDMAADLSALLGAYPITGGVRIQGVSFDRVH